jgi:hypothetical protein
MSCADQPLTLKVFNDFVKSNEDRWKANHEMLAQAIAKNFTLLEQVQKQVDRIESDK